MTARGTKTEEFEYVETLLRNPQKIHLRKKIEQIEEEIDPRKEALVAYRVFVRIHTSKKKTTVITRNTRKGESAKWVHIEEDIDPHKEECVAYRLLCQNRRTKTKAFDTTQHQTRAKC